MQNKIEEILVYQLNAKINKKKGFEK